MLDLIPDNQDDTKVLAYMDGRDARLFNSLVSKLGSEEKVQNAFILMGLITKLERKGAIEDVAIVKHTKTFFPEYVGVSFEKFNALLNE